MKFPWSTHPYLPSPVRGQYFYLYFFVDVWSRMIVGWAVHSTEDSKLAAQLFRDIYALHGISPDKLMLHSDNGGPMKGATMLATLQALGVMPSFSRPHVSDDNPFSEALFRTTKYRPDYPDGPFASLEATRAWVEAFVNWYNHEHHHSGIRFVIPADRHEGREAGILAHRAQVLEAARCRHPERWSGSIRNCTPVGSVTLNPAKVSTSERMSEQQSTAAA